MRRDRWPLLSAPEPLSSAHALDAFHCGVEALDDWLKLRALRNEAERASRTFVAAGSNRVVAYYSLAASSLLREQATRKIGRNMPEPIPVVLVGRLAVDRAWQGKGLGADLLRDAVMRTLAASESIGVRALLVHAISDAAKAFYEKHGFRASPIGSMTLMIGMTEAEREFARE